MPAGGYYQIGFNAAVDKIKSALASYDFAGAAQLVNQTNSTYSPLGFSIPEEYRDINGYLDKHPEIKSDMEKAVTPNGFATLLQDIQNNNNPQKAYGLYNYAKQNSPGIAEAFAPQIKYYDSLRNMMNHRITETGWGSLSPLEYGVWQSVPQDVQEKAKANAKYGDIWWPGDENNNPTYVKGWSADPIKGANGVTYTPQFDGSGKVTGYTSNAHTWVAEATHANGRYDAAGTPNPPISVQRNSGNFFSQMAGDFAGMLADLGPIGQIGLAFALGPVGASLGTTLGVSAVAGSAIATGLVNTALTGDVTKGLKAGLGSYVGAELGQMAGDAAKVGDFGEFLKNNPGYATMFANQVGNIAVTNPDKLGDSILGIGLNVFANAAISDIPALKDASPAIKSAISQEIASGIQRGEFSFDQSLKNVGLSGLSSYALNQSEDFKNLDPKWKSLVTTNLRAALSGKDLGQATLSWALTQGQKEVANAAKQNAVEAKKFGQNMMKDLGFDMTEAELNQVFANVANSQDAQAIADTAMQKVAGAGFGDNVQDWKAAQSLGFDTADAYYADLINKTPLTSDQFLQTLPGFGADQIGPQQVNQADYTFPQLPPGYVPPSDSKQTEVADVTQQLVDAINNPNTTVSYPGTQVADVGRAGDPGSGVYWDSSIGAWRVIDEATDEDLEQLGVGLPTDIGSSQLTDQDLADIVSGGIGDATLTGGAGTDTSVGGQDTQPGGQDTQPGGQETVVTQTKDADTLRAEENDRIAAAAGFPDYSSYLLFGGDHDAYERDLALQGEIRNRPVVTPPDDDTTEDPVVTPTKDADTLRAEENQRIADAAGFPDYNSYTFWHGDIDAYNANEALLEQLRTHVYPVVTPPDDDTTEDPTVTQTKSADELRNEENDRIAAAAGFPNYSSYLLFGGDHDAYERDLALQDEIRNRPVVTPPDDDTTEDPVVTKAKSADELRYEENQRIADAAGFPNYSAYLLYNGDSDAYERDQALQDEIRNRPVVTTPVDDPAQDPVYIYAKSENELRAEENQRIADAAGFPDYASYVLFNGDIDAYNANEVLHEQLRTHVNPVDDPTQDPTVDPTVDPAVTQTKDADTLRAEENDRIAAAAGFPNYASYLLFGGDYAAYELDLALQDEIRNRPVVTPPVDDGTTHDPVVTPTKDADTLRAEENQRIADAAGFPNYAAYEMFNGDIDAYNANEALQEQLRTHVNPADDPDAEDKKIAAELEAYAVSEGFPSYQEYLNYAGDIDAYNAVQDMLKNYDDLMKGDTSEEKDINTLRAEIADAAGFPDYATYLQYNGDYDLYTAALDATDDGQDTTPGGEDTTDGGEDTQDGGEDTQDGGQDTTCAAGFHWDDALQMCIADTDTITDGEDTQDGGEDTQDGGQDTTCAAGFHWDEDRQMCMPDDDTTDGEDTTPGGEDTQDGGQDTTCAAGFHWDEDRQMCMPDDDTTDDDTTDDDTTDDDQDTTCAAGFHWDEDRQMCMPDDDQDTTCAAGFHWDEDRQMCMPDDDQDTTCAAGFHWDEDRQMCMPDDDTTDDPTSCPDGYVYNFETRTCEPVDETPPVVKPPVVTPPVVKPPVSKPATPTKQTPVLPEQQSSGMDLAALLALMGGAGTQQAAPTQPAVADMSGMVDIEELLANPLQTDYRKLANKPKMAEGGSIDDLLALLNQKE